MNAIKKLLGIVWLLLGPAIMYFLVAGAVQNIDSSGAKDINNPVIWIIIIAIFMPIAVGIMIFGWYALKGEYDSLPTSSDDIKLL